MEYRLFLEKGQTHFFIHTDLREQLMQAFGSIAIETLSGTKDLQAITTGVMYSPELLLETDGLMHRLQEFDVIIAEQLNIL